MNAETWADNFTHRGCELLMEDRTCYLFGTLCPYARIQCCEDYQLLEARRRENADLREGQRRMEDMKQHHVGWGQ
jgi:hypothetical protein